MGRFSTAAIRGLLMLGVALALAGCGAENAAPGSGVVSTPAPAQTAVPASPTPAPATAPAASSAYLVSAAGLIPTLNDPALRVVDMGSGDEYAAGHIPGAVHIDWSELQVTDTSASSIAAWQGAVTTLLGQRGISAQDRVVVYDHGTLYGARLWWVLDQLGHAQKQVLDGGFAAWQAAGGPVVYRRGGTASRDLHGPSAARRAGDRGAGAGRARAPTSNSSTRAIPTSTAGKTPAAPPVAGTSPARSTCRSRPRRTAPRRACSRLPTSYAPSSARRG